MSLDLMELDGEPHMLVTVSDQTEHKRAVAALRRPTSACASWPRRSTRCSTSAHRIRFTLHYMSPAYESMWGRPLASVYANPLTAFDAIVDEDRDRVLADMAKPCDDDVRIHEFRIARPDGNVRWIRMRSSRSAMRSASSCGSPASRTSHRAARPRGSAAPGAEDGIDRHAGWRYRARLQQPALGDLVV